ncbi:hypothetical protein OHA21_13220 [Actinoplanes sp. NBC_00393]|uniref:hypothetical protein n=1 Tax=Actinoplanes sp. NBC_00393 TaxID=2975953 RepID=UPI002E24A8F9
MSRSQRISALAATSVATFAMIALPTSPVYAASACVQTNTYKTNPNHPPYTARIAYCDNVAPTTVYSGATFAEPAGKLTTSRSWFMCFNDHGEYHGRGPHPTRWLYTKADTPANTWGYVPDFRIYSETDTVATRCFS